MSKSASKRDTRIPRRPLLWLAAALLFTLPPMFGKLTTWVPCLFLITLAVKFWMEPMGYQLRFAALKLVLAGIALVAIYSDYGTLKSIESGVSLLVVLMALKILEAHTAREFQVMVMMAWVLCLCGFFLSQDFGMALCLMVAFGLLIVALIQFHRGSSPGAFWPPLLTTCKLLAQATPIVVLLFFLFPRINTGFRFETRDLRSAGSGFSDRLSPGSIATLATSADIAFRAEFPDYKTRPPAPMYWRGVVMWNCKGMEWRAPRVPEPLADSSRRSPSDKLIRQRITLAPHGGRWMFGLDRPVEVTAGAMLAQGNYIRSVQPIRKARRYEVTSSREITEKERDTDEREEALELPAGISPAVRELVQSWIAQNSNPRAIINNALQFFRTQGFRYSLSPGEYKKNDLDEFLLHRRVGFCEHYAASFATLMRVAGIPARVVVGYLGGEYNDLGRFFLVRQADTHAWSEVWLPDSGWTRVDPTSAVAPGRTSLDLNSFLERRATLGEIENRRSSFASRLARWAIFNNVRLAWEALNYEWDTRVLGFDTDVQEALLASTGITDRGPFFLVTESVLIASALLVIYAGWMRLRTRERADRIKLLYERFCRKVAQLGVRRDPSEGPSDFSGRASASLPNESRSIRQITDSYIALRYAPNAMPVVFDKFAKDVGAFVSSRSE
jgi:protein-glutamine gamma-glutamyltransferase